MTSFYNSFSGSSVSKLALRPPSWSDVWSPCGTVIALKCVLLARCSLGALDAVFVGPRPIDRRSLRLVC